MTIRNVAIIAHVDHGKTTLVDAILKQTGVFRANQQVNERVLDSNALERERGITILSKNIAVVYNGCKINIVDTPGHADFGGEVERVLGMVDGALLVVDAVEGPMPQTRFVLRKALDHKLALVVVVNKTDRPLAQPDEAVNRVFDLLVSLGASDEQLDFPYYYASALTGRAGSELEELSADTASILPILDGIIARVPPPAVNPDGPLQMMISYLDYDDYVGRIALGRVRAGVLEQGQDILITHSERETVRRGKLAQLYTFRHLHRVPAEAVEAGDIAAFSGMDDIQIGETVNQVDHPCPLPAIHVDDPTLTMIFRVNDSPLAGKEAAYVTSRHLRDRLLREAKINVALQVEMTNSADAFRVSGRGELHLSVLMETMRREGYTFAVTRPEPILRTSSDGVEEPFEHLVVDVPQEHVGAVMEVLGERKGEVLVMEPSGDGRVRLEFSIPARGLIGFGSQFMTETKGYGIMHHSFDHYGPWAGAIPQRLTGSLVAWEDGEATAYALQSIEQRGTLFIGPGTRVYAGMIVGEHSRSGDLEVNVAKKKHVTNIRAAGADDAVRLAPPRVLGLEEAVAYLAEDEYLEVTPQSLRLRKALLDRHKREQERKKRASELV